MSKELIEMKCATWPLPIYFIVEPIRQGMGEDPRVKLCDDNERFIEEFESWTDMDTQFAVRGWQIVDVAVWDISDTFAGEMLLLNQLAATGCTKDTDWGDLIEAQKEHVS